MTRRAAPAAGASRAATGFNPAWLAQRLRALAGPLRGSRLCVAYSGGADSTALLSAAAALRARCGFGLRALHVNHRLQPAAAAMARAARAGARRLGVPCRVLDAPVRIARGASLEAVAREARYAALHAALRPGEWLLLAQHQDDQVEALLLQLLRGAGIAGLAAMPARSGFVLRPLLDVPRAQLQGYLARRALAWFEDPSNADERHGRNFLRLRILPLLRERWPALGTTIGRSAALAAEALALLEQLADAQLQPALDGAALRVGVLRRLAPAERRNALRRWLQRRGLPMPDQRRLGEIAGPLLRARSDAQPQVRWPGALLQRHGDLLYADAPEPAARPPGAARRPGAAQSAAPPLVAGAAATAGAAAAELQWNWLAEPRLSLPDGARLELQRDRHGDLLRSALPPRVSVSFRGAGSAAALLRDARRRKRALRAGNLPPWQRHVVPLLHAHGRLLAVGDWWQAPQLRATASSAAAERCRLAWSPGGAGA